MLKFIRPALPVLVDAPPPGDGWIHEIKYDGYRTQVIVEDGKARIYSRRGLDWTRDYHPIAATAETLRCSSAIIDGEVYLPDARGAADFHNLRSTISRHPERLVFMAFDLLHLDGEDYRPRPIEDRRDRLSKLIKTVRGNNIWFSPAFEMTGAEAFAAVEKLGLEGVVSKRLGSRYKSGDAADWLKAKTFTISTFDLVGVDRTDKRGIPEVLLAQDGAYAGKAMLSLPAGQRDEFWKFVHTHALPRSTIRAPGKTATWLPPGIRARVKHLRGEAQLRHASFLGIEPPDGD
jgi:ATP-dependent DNA ligase